MIGRLTWPPTLEIKKEPALWVLAGLGSFLLFIFLTFPYGTLQARILSEITQRTGWEVRAAGWSPGIPIAVEWHDLIWSNPGGISIPVRAMRLDVGVIGAIIGRRRVDALVQFPGPGQLGGGRVIGTVSAAAWSFLGPVSLEGHIQQVDLATVAKTFVTRGLLQADIAHRWENRGKEGFLFKGDGSWRGEVKDLVLDRIPIATGFIPPLSFSRVNVNVNCRDTICDIADFRGDGPDGTVTAQGRILLQQPLEASTLEVSVTVLAGAGWAQKAGNLPIPPLQPGTPLTFKLAGSVANPRLTL